MQTDDELTAIVEEQDREWLSAHRSELWIAAQVGHKERGRGAVLVIFEEVGRDEIVIAYTDRLNWPTPVIAAQIAQYNPVTELVIVCLGQLDNPAAQVGPRGYVVQYLTLAA